MVDLTQVVFFFVVVVTWLVFGTWKHGPPPTGRFARTKMAGSMKPGPEDGVIGYC